MRMASLPVVFISCFVLACSSASPGTTGISGSGTGGGPTGGGAGTSGGTPSGGVDDGGDPGGDDGSEVTEFTWRIEPETGAVTFEWPPVEGSPVNLVLVQGTPVITLPATNNRVTIDESFAELEAKDGHYRVEIGDGETAYQGQIKYTERFPTFFDDENLYPGPKQDEGVVSIDMPLAAEDGDTVTVTGKAGGDGLRPRAYVGSPSGPVETIVFGEEDLEKDDEYAFSFEVTERGIWVVELVRATDKLPAVVRPVYVTDGSYEDGIPIVTPPLDDEKFPMAPVDVDVARDVIKQMTNERRSIANLNALSTHNGLDASALKKAEQMAEHQIFTHGSSAGPVQKVGDLAAAEGITGAVNESIGVEINPELVWWGWWWSPSHRIPMLDGRWSSQGVGAAMFNPQWYHIVFVQHFAQALP